LRIPGTWIVSANDDARQELQLLVSLITNAFEEAAMAFILFEKFRAEETHRARVERWRRDRNREWELLPPVISSAGFSPEDLDRLHEAAHRQRVIEEWEAGIVPESLSGRQPFIAAKAFVHAADEIGKILNTLAERSDLSDEARDACRVYYSSFPMLREIRNSIQHLEDRGRGLGRGKRPLNLKPINNVISAPGGALVIDFLNGNRYGITMADGHYGEVEISAGSVAAMRDVVQAALDKLPWTGSPRFIP
jgi:hypothetical protein